MLCVAVLALPAAPQAAAHSSGTGQMVTLFGYEHEAYLKITAHGIWQNTLSPATYLNDDLTIGEIPRSANATAPPK